MYNKRKFNKVNDKKVLHKVKKQWVTLSLALFMMIGGGAVATHVSANADSTNNAQAVATKPQAKANNITSQAKNLHQTILANAEQSKPTMKLGATPAPTYHIVQHGNWDGVNVNYWNNNVMELTGTGAINASDVPNLPSNNNVWALKIDKSNAHITLNNNKNGGQFSANFHPIWKNVDSMDLSGLDTSKVTNMSSMFENDQYITSLDLSHFNTNNVKHMDYMFNNDLRLQSLNLSNLNNNASKKNIFDDDALTELILSNNSKLGSQVFSFTPLSSAYNSLIHSSDPNTSDVPAFTYGSDGAVPMKYIYNYYPANKNSLMINGGQLVMNSKGNDVTSAFKNGTLPAGTYYLASPLPVNLVTQLTNPYYNQPYSDMDNKLGAFYPVSQVHDNSNYDSDYLNISSLDFTPQVKSMLANDKTFHHDYTILPGSGYITTSKDGNGDDVPLLNIKINLNASKYVNDANSTVASEFNQAKTYCNDISYDASYAGTSSEASSDMSNYSNMLNLLASSSTDEQHDLSEPADGNTVEDASEAESEANYDYNNILSEVKQNNSYASSTKASDNKAMSNVADLTNDALERIEDNQKLLGFTKVNSNAMNNDLNTVKQASSAIKSDIAQSTATQSLYTNAESAFNEAENALGDSNKILANADSAVSHHGSTSAKPSSKASSTNSANSKASNTNSKATSQSVAPKSSASKPSSSASNSASTSTASESPKANASQSSSANNNNSSASTKPSSASVAPSSASKSISSSNTSTNSSSAKSSATKSASTSSKAASSSANSFQASKSTSSSVAPSSTSAQTSSSASAQTSSATSQSNSSATSSSASASSSAAPQSNDNNASTPFVTTPSFNTPTTPITPTPSFNTPSTPAPSVSVTPAPVENTPVAPTTNNENNSSVNVPSTDTLTKHDKNNGSLYLFNTNFKHLAKKNRAVVTNKGLWEYKRNRKGKYTKAVFIKPHTKLAVKRVLKFGKYTRLQLTNGMLVTGNKKFVTVKVNKRTKVSNYTKAYNKATSVLKHGRKHAKRHVYRESKNFFKAVKAEKKASRKLTRKHNYRNKKALNKAKSNLNNLIKLLLK